jgi:hypothetical protein
LAGRRPEIILTDKAGALLEVDALAYPEDTHLIVDPNAILEESNNAMSELVAHWPGLRVWLQPGFSAWSCLILSGTTTVELKQLRKPCVS